MTSGKTESFSHLTLICQFSEPPPQCHVVLVSPDRAAVDELLAALTAGMTNFHGARSAVVPLDDEYVDIISSYGKEVVIAVGPLACFRTAARRTREQDGPGSRLWNLVKAVPDEVEIYRVATGRDLVVTKFSVRVEDDTAVIDLEAREHPLTRELLREPASWENSDPMELLLRELDIRSPVTSLRVRSFAATAIALPILLSLVIVTAVVDFSVGTNVACVGLGFALQKSWNRYAEMVREHINLADEQRWSPSKALMVRIGFLFRVAVYRNRQHGRLIELADHVRFSDSSDFEGIDPVRPAGRNGIIRVRRYRYMWHRFLARRWKTWHESHVEPVLGSYPPNWNIHVSANRLVRPLDRLRSRLILRSVLGLLKLYGRCDRISVDTWNRFMDGAHWIHGRRDPRSHAATDAYVAAMFLPMFDRSPSNTDSYRLRSVPIRLRFMAHVAATSAAE